MEEKKPLKIVYLFHSGFLVETERHLLIFDYYREAAGSKASTSAKAGELPEFLQTDKQVYIFASHRHADHYNPGILEWGKIKPDLTYILSNDIKPRWQGERIHLVAPGAERGIDSLYLKVLGSTDQGVSFLVEIEGWHLFHAGDLNWWYWEDDSETELLAAERSFKHEISKLEGEALDLAFFPVDPRLGAYYHLGGAYLIQQLQPNHFIPMHFGTDVQITKSFAQQIKAPTTRVITIDQSPQTFLIKN
ncbi:MAG TPA: MBL fold metallo-hydrolase [Firmicutes bacterium]|jgi:L-ascorbate metabolism protein UlaG (beta-lactamase superfamily)|nr:MBL fold metallo-hydrolase [Bacillota bacterium]